MKKIIIVFSICILIMQQNKLKAQATWDFNHTTWKTASNFAQGAYWFNYVTVDSISPDTVINSVTYKKIRDEFGQYILGIRSNNHKLYGIDAGTGPLPHHEYLMYDFSANAGDTIRDVAVSQYNFYFEDTMKVYVVAKDSFLLNNKYYMALQVQLFFQWGGGGWNAIWYENIGSDGGLIETIGQWYPPFLDCYSNNDSTVDIPSLPNQWSFTTVPTVPISYGNPCFFIPLTNGINEQQNETTIQISPNPTTNEFRITNYEFAIKSIKIFTVLGEEIINEKWTMEKEQCVVDISGYAKGIYFVRVGDENRNVVNRKIVLQ